MRVPLRLLILVVGCVAVTVEALTGNALDATAVLTVAGVIAL